MSKDWISCIKTQVPGPVYVYVLVLTLVLALFSLGRPGEITYAAKKMQVGDYVQFGKYDGEAVLWRVVKVEKDGSPLLYSEKVVCLKAYDAAESGTYLRAGDNPYTNDQKRQVTGSSNWERSNLREWLNSTDSEVKYSTQPPSKAAVSGGKFGYDTEPGFLNGFTEAERQTIKATVRKSVLADADKEESIGGSRLHNYNTSIAGCVTNYDLTYYKMLEEKVFLFDVKELSDYVASRGWECGRLPGKYVIKQQPSRATTDYFPYWLRIPSSGDSTNLRIVQNNQTVTHGVACSMMAGVVPALELVSGIYRSGKGTVAEPYLPYVNEPKDVGMTEQGTLQFVDNNLEAVIRKAIGKTSGQLVAEDVESLTSLKASNAKIENLSGIERLSNLEQLELSNNLIDSVEPIRRLVRLKQLALDGNKLASVEALSDMTDMVELKLSRNAIEELLPLQGMSRLKGLELQGCPIRDVLPLENLKELERLKLDGFSSIGEVRKLIGSIHTEAKIEAENVASGKKLNVNFKSKSTYYTAEKLENARSNITRYPWAKKLRDDAVSNAEAYLALGLDGLWESVTAQSMPRSYAVNQSAGCLNCGKAIDKFGQYPYLVDPLNTPWKVECPNCRMKFPTNDYGAYYKSGLDKNGKFDAKKANRSLLVNTTIPSKGKAWGVDDGTGFKKGKSVYTFVACYNHWGLWYRGMLNTALNKLRDAYLYTNDLKYSRAGIVVLDRIADIYPEMDVSAYTKKGFANCDGSTGKGKVLGSVWETELARDFSLAYDAFYPAYVDSQTITFLYKKGKLFNTKQIKSSGAALRKNVENRILRQIFPAIKKSQIRGNNGMLQSTLALAAVVLDANPETKQWLTFDFKAGVSNKDNVTGGSLYSSLIDDVDRDGNGNEAAPLYNKDILSRYIEVADILDGYKAYAYADLYRNPKLHKMFYAMSEQLLSDNHSAMIGDSGAAGAPINYLNKDQLLKAFELYAEPVAAQLIYYLNGNTVDKLRFGIFSKEPESASEKIAAAIETSGTLQLASRNYTGYGLGVLRDGEGQISFSDRSASAIEAAKENIGQSTQRSMFMYYGRNFGHGHADTLNLGMNGFGLDLAPDLGYPDYADGSANRHEWVSNTISHNTVVVDKMKQSNQLVGIPRHFDSTEAVKLIDVEAPGVYPQTSEYRRTTAMIQIDEKNSYYVDFFKVKGGKDHYYSFHGAEGAVKTSGLALSKQKTGSYAGASVRYGLRPSNDSKPSYDYTGGGFHWLKDVNRDNKAKSKFSVDWEIFDTWNVLNQGKNVKTNIHLKLTMLSRVDDVALAKGELPANKTGNASSFTYMIAHRKVPATGSLFCSVMEPYTKVSAIRDASVVEVKKGSTVITDESAKALKITFQDGRVDYVVYSSDPKASLLIDKKINFQGFFGVLSLKNGQREFCYMQEGGRFGSYIPSATPAFTGTVIGFTKILSGKNTITVKGPSSMTTDKIKGSYIYVETDKIRNGVYKVLEAKKATGGMVVLDIGDVTPIRSLVDPANFSKGYIYDIKQGARFTIPLGTLVK